jgi:hypothetical protein
VAPAAWFYEVTRLLVRTDTDALEQLRRLFTERFPDGRRGGAPSRSWHPERRRVIS